MCNLSSTGIKKIIFERISLVFMMGFFINLFNLIFVFILHILLARYLGAENYGRYFFIVTLVAVISLFTKAGADTLLLRYLPKYIVENNQRLIAGIFNYVIRETLVRYIIISSIACIVIFVSNINHLMAYPGDYYYGLILLFCISFLHIAQSVLAGFKRIIKSQLPERVVFPLLFALFLFSWDSYGASNITAGIAINMHILAIVIALILVCYFFSTQTDHNIFYKQKEFNKTLWQNSSRSFIYITASFMVLNQIDVLMVGMLLNKEQSGIYGVAARVAILTAYGLHATNLIIAPYVSKFYTEKSISTLKKLLQTAAKYNLLISLLIASLIFFFGTDILYLFGNEFIGGKIVLFTLCIGQLINVAAGSVGVLMNMSGHEHPAAKIMIFAVIFNIILNAFLIPVFEMEGAALATAITTAFWNIGMLNYSCKYIGINTSIVNLPFKVQINEQ